MRVATMFRYPVKGLSPEEMRAARLSPGRMLSWDRAFALAQGDAGFDPASPGWRPKTEFLCLARNPEAWRLNARFDETTRLITLIAPDGAMIDASPFNDEGRQALADFIVAALPDAIRGTPRFVHVEGHHFSDHKVQVISLIGHGSLAALASAAGATREALRFRANLYIDDIDPWAEFTWLGRTIAIGAARLRVTSRIVRCAATMVNPETGRRDANPPQELMAHFGHTDCGIYAEVLEGGTVMPGDEVRLLA